jgi:hypothetical protein
VVKNISIKNNKLCKTNPISKKLKMVVTLVITRTNNNEQPTMNYSKQTQTKPICSELARPERGRRVEPILSAVALAKADSQGRQSGVNQLGGGVRLSLADLS